jgi:hypothetical protein
VTALDPSQYSGGKIFVATSSTFGPGILGYYGSTGPVNANPGGIPGTTAYLPNTYQGPFTGTTGIGSYVFSQRITDDLATIAGIIGGQNWVNYVNNFYWAPNNPALNYGLPDYYTQLYNFPAISPSGSAPLLTPLNAIFSGPYFQSRQLSGFSGAITQQQWWDQSLFPDIQAFFGQ